MFAEERQEVIFQIVNRRGSVRVAELSEELDISEVTIRRDLEELQRQNRVVRTHGGAMSTYSAGNGKSFSQHAVREVEQKRRIAKAAYSMVLDDNTLLLDNSSTAIELLRLIAAGGKKNIRIITTSLLAPTILKDVEGCTLQIVGGEVNFTSQSVEGSSACSFLRGVRVDKCFVGINGIDEEFGFSTPRYMDADIKNCIIHSAHCSIILADNTKIGKSFLAHVDAPDYLITDRKVPGFSYDALTETTVIFANKTNQSEAETV